MYRDNGRFHPSWHWDQPEGGSEAHFPAEEVFTDFAGRKLTFRVEIEECPTGWLAKAVEQTDRREGYRFRGHDATSWVLALGELREKIYRGLATRHVEPSDTTLGWVPTHDELRGRIDWDSETDTPGFVIDGEMFSAERFAELLATHAGFGFYLRFEE